MKTLRPALLVLLTLAVAGLGVPAGFGQAQAAAKRPSKKKNSANGSSTTPRTSNVSAGGKRTSGKTSSKSSRSRRQPGQKAPNADRINEIQAALSKDGSFHGSPTGKWDSETTEAMRRYQVAHGLNPNGKLDAPTLQRLGLGSQTAGVARPTPPPGSVSRLTSSSFAPAGSSEDNPQQ